MNISIFNTGKGGHPLFIICSLLILNSCIREEIIDDVNLGEGSQPVVLCTLTPGDSIKLMLINSSYGVDNSLTYNERGIFGAKVKIFDPDGTSIFLLSDADLPLYKASQSDFPIHAGETYFVEINLTNGKRLTSQTTLPDKPIKWDDFGVNSVDTILLDTTINGKYYEFKIEKTLKGTWQDPRNITRVFVSNDKYPYSGMNAVNLEQNYIKHTLCCKILSDYQITTYYKIQPENESEEYIHFFHLITLNPDLKEYFRIYDLQFQNKESLDTDQFLELFRGVYPEFTNIEGGLGVFGGYLTDERIVQ